MQTQRTTDKENIEKLRECVLELDRLLRVVSLPLRETEEESRQAVRDFDVVLGSAEKAIVKWRNRQSIPVERDGGFVLTPLAYLDEKQRSAEIDRAFARDPNWNAR
jgi:hypothetical protein